MNQKEIFDFLLKKFDELENDFLVAKDPDVHVDLFIQADFFGTTISELFIDCGERELANNIIDRIESMNEIVSYKTKGKGVKEDEIYNDFDPEIEEEYNNMGSRDHDDD
jgi:hypothetical protein